MQYRYRLLRNMMITEGAIRDSLRLEVQKQKKFKLHDSLPIVDTYAETAANEDLMEDRSSPTKISQQRLRAQTGEAALMQML